MRWQPCSFCSFRAASPSWVLQLVSGGTSSPKHCIHWGVESVLHSSIPLAFDGTRSHGQQHRPQLPPSSSNPRPYVAVALGGNQDTHLSMLLTSLTSPDMSLSRGHEPFCPSVSLSHTTPYICSPWYCHHKVPGGLLFFSSEPRQTAPGLFVGLLVPLGLSWHWGGPCFFLTKRSW